MAIDSRRFALQFRNRKKAIEESLDSGSLKVFGSRAFDALVKDRRADWRMVSVPIRAIVELLEKESHLSRIDLASEIYNSEKRLLWRTPTPFQIALSIRQGAYLSHATAAYLHGLLGDVPATFYLNKEQSQKASGGSLLQAGIDRAFSSRQRESKLVYSDPNGSRYVVLAGRFTNRLEVGSLKGPSGEDLVSTKVERTLIDLVVRPLYAGGVQKVLEAFSNAKGIMSTNVLVATLKKLAYVYPYHQSVGFYLERAGFDARVLDRIREMGLAFDFYLAHGIKDPAFDPNWRIHYPRGL